MFISSISFSDVSIADTINYLLDFKAVANF